MKTTTQNLLKSCFTFRNDLYSSWSWSARRPENMMPNWWKYKWLH